MNRKTSKKSFILPLILITVSSVLLLSTLVLFQAYYAYVSARQQYRVYQREYALKGLLNQAVDECKARIKTMGHLNKPYNYSVSAWAVLIGSTKPTRITVEPQHDLSYKITATIGSESKTGIFVI